MEYKDISIESIKEAMESMVYIPTERKVKMYTNAYGADQFEEALMNYAIPSHRIYYGKKMSRIIKNNVKLNKSHYTGRWYKTIKNGE